MANLIFLFILKEKCEIDMYSITNIFRRNTRAEQRVSREKRNILVEHGFTKLCSKPIITNA